ncbi:MAG: hypothetical protein J0H06_12975 [Actinobacteria bacterium]|nr:hypothetical protein [Actinomycetota bacterium]
MGTIEEILVSDWGKLSTAAADARTRWGINSQLAQQQTSAMELGINQWMWKAILPGAYELVYLSRASPGTQEWADPARTLRRRELDDLAPGMGRRRRTREVR